MNKYTDIKHYGTILDTDIISHNDHDKMIIESLKNAYMSKLKGPESADSDHPVLNFPLVSTEPEDEYDGIPIFSNAFPWLFPGGIGDINCNKKKDYGYVQKWASTMVHYFDGRFIRDGTWCFYALNYVQRHQNNISGGFFVRDFIKTNRPSDIEELKAQIQKGDYSFIDKLIYFSSKVRGSDSYWRLKKSQLYTWVYWHIEKGHGAPSLFITLSCAEYYWPDIKRLIEDRVSHTETNSEKSHIDINTKQKRMKAVNQYSIVVQEYFITRVKDWMESFAKDILKVQHYYTRFEFAKGRGEIHAHILAIADNKDTLVAAYRAETEKEKVEVLSQYAHNVLGLTSQFPASDEEENNENAEKQNPAEKRLSEIENHEIDKLHLCNTSQTHKCGDYCMRINTKYKQNQRRFCRAGCGYEQTPGTCDTPGFPINEINVIKKDDKGTKKLYLKRDHTRMIQTSMKTLQSWRSNCDIQLILYDSDPNNPDLGELSKVTDYIVSYACKRNCTHEAEKQALLDIVFR